MQKQNDRHAEAPPNDSERTGHMTDRECLDAYIHHGDRNALGELICRHQPLVFRVCYRCLNNNEDALDATQEVFLKLCHHAHRIEREVGGWLAACASNTAISYIRSESARRRREGKCELDSAVDWVDAIEGEDTAFVVHQYLANMPAGDRQLLESHLIHGLSQATLAKKLGVSQQAISKRIANLKDLFRQNLVKKGIASLGATVASSIPGKAIHAAVAEIWVTVAAVKSSKSAALLILGLAAVSMPPEQTDHPPVDEYARSASTTENSSPATWRSEQYGHLASQISHQYQSLPAVTNSKAGQYQSVTPPPTNSHVRQASRIDDRRPVSTDSRTITQAQGGAASDSVLDHPTRLAHISIARQTESISDRPQAPRIRQDQTIRPTEAVNNSAISILGNHRYFQNRLNAVFKSHSGDFEFSRTTLSTRRFPKNTSRLPGFTLGLRDADRRRIQVTPDYPDNEFISFNWVVDASVKTTQPVKRAWLQAIASPRFDIRVHRTRDPHMRKKTKHSLAVLPALAAFPVSAGVTASNEDQAGYDTLSNQSAYSSVGLIDWHGGLASGVYIGDGWVLTAAHVAEASQTFDFTINDTAYTSSDIYTYASWDGNAANGNDLALIQLGTHVEDVSPALLYDPMSGDGSELLGSVATYTGYGKTGDGTSGATGSAGTFGAGQNLIESFGGSTALLNDYSDSVFFSDFDNPDNALDGLPWSENAALDYEYLIATGDSGGGVFIESDGQEYLVGINSFILARDGDPNSDYGDISGATYIPDYYDWIFGLTGIEAGSPFGSSNIPEPSSLALLVMAGSFVARRRRQL